MEHKPWVLPDVDLSHDEGDQRYHDAGGHDMTPEYDDEGKIKFYRWNGLEPGHYAGYWQLCVVDDWETTVNEYEAHPDDVHAAWWYVDHHPVFWTFTKNIHPDYPVNHVCHLNHDSAWRTGWPDITPHKVNPDTGRVDKDTSLNTKVDWWYEFGPTDLTPGCCKSHDWELDGGAETFEAAVLEMAGKIHRYYGNDRRLVDDDGYWSNRVVEEPLSQRAAWVKQLSDQLRERSDDD